MENKEVKKPGNGCYNENCTNQHNKKPFQHSFYGDFLPSLFPFFRFDFIQFFQLSE
tara:strand:- start:1870 stop:2037 length:168 start_codon:yes stop_codon:yes gene_type:complete